jgi:hypothetical protein
VNADAKGWPTRLWRVEDLELLVSTTHRERKMTISFAKIGFWKLLGVGTVLELAHLALQHRWPELSPHYLGPRPVFAKIFLISEYCFALAAMMAAAGTIENICTQHSKGAHPVLIVVAYAAYFSLCVWVLRR